MPTPSAGAPAKPPELPLALSTSAAWRSAYPFASHWLRTPEGVLHYVDHGPASCGDREALAIAAEPASSDVRTLLFVHGNPTWSFHWRHLIAALGSRYRCVAIDHLGCGLSGAASRPLALADRVEHLVQLLGALDLRQTALVAQDWGGAIGLGALLRAPERFVRIALFNTGAFPPWYIPLRIRACRWPVAGRLAIQGGNLFSRAALRMTLARRRRLDPAVAAAYLAPYGSWGRRAAVYQFVRDIPASPRHPTWSTLETLEQGLQRMAPLPTRLIWGARDWCFTTGCRDRFAAIWPHAEIRTLADVGHWVVEDAPAEALEELADFVAAPGGTGVPR